MYVAIDVGGTKTLISVVDADGAITESQKIKTPKKYEEFIVELASTVDNLSTDSFSAGCIALPGKIDRENGIGISFGNLPWEDVHAQADCERLFHCPFLVENDANLAGLGEATALGDAYKKVLYITVSTGIGSALVINGALDPTTLDAEAGQILLEHNGELQRWEKIASGSAIVAKYGKRASDLEDPQAWYAIAHNLATGFITVIATYTPDIIVIGGGVGTHLDKFKDRLVELLTIYENPLLTIPPIVQAQHPEEAVIHGCYQLIKQWHETAH
jgi:predicted NBD/HSP70 family sugar kinase